MDNEPKKISFAFSKCSKKSNLLVKPPPVEEKKIEIIEYLEEKSIKVVGGDDKPKGPLVIPMKQPNKKLINLVEIVKNDFKEPEQETNEATNSQNGKAEKPEDQKPLENLTLEEQAARELLNDSHNNSKVKEEVKRVIDASKNTDKVTFEGEKESSIEDYEDIPIEEFGKAMLRGMGWKDGHGIGKNEQLIKMAQPLQRPKGMGLGADKLTKEDKNEKPAVDRDGNALKCVKKAYVKIIAGYHKGHYGQIIGLDDESGRFIIKTALNNINVSLNEFLVTPVTKEEYTKNSKVINNAKYEEFIKKKEIEEQIKLKQASIKQEKDSDSPNEDRNKKEKKNDKKVKNYDRSDSEEDRRRRDKDKKIIKKERRSSESDVEDNRSSKREKNNREIKKERKSSNSEYEEKYSKKDKYEKRTVKKERRSSESDYEDNRRNRKDKYEQSTSKYDSDNYKKEENRDRKSRDKYKQSKSKHYSDDSDSEREVEKRKSKKKSSKYDSDTDDFQQSSKKKHKKKKSKKHSSEDSSEEKYKRKSKKNDRKKYDGSDSEYEEKSKKSQKKDKHREKRDRSRHDKESRK